MRKIRWMIALALLLVTSLGCGLLSNVQNGVQQIQSAATQLPGMLTAAPSMVGPMETAAAQMTAPSGSGSSGAAQGLSIDNLKTILQVTGEVKFTDSTVGGQPATIATLSDTGVSTFPAMGTAFSATFIGDTSNLSQIKIAAPRSDAQDTVDQGIALNNLMLSGVLSPSVQVSFSTWLTENYAGVAVGGTLSKTVENVQFTLDRTAATETLTVVPSK